MNDIPIVCIDCETTGLDIQKDAVFSFASIRITPGIEQPFRLDLMIKPWKPIPPEIEQKCHTTNKDVANCKPFAYYAKSIYETLNGAALVGFNLINFDCQILWEELNRCGFKLNFDGVPIIDVSNLYRKFNPRDLTACVKQYCGRDHSVDAHGAMPDAAATLECLHAMRFIHNEIADMTTDNLSNFCQIDDRNGSRRLDLDGTVVLNKDGIPVFGTKRNRGVPIKDDLGYAAWILRSDFPGQTLEVLSKVVDKIQKELSEERTQQKAMPF